jgi:large subunit ribosomal protein L15
MRLNELAGNGALGLARRRVGRGIGSGLGKTSGRGQKGQGSRSGVALGGFEGGQMPIHMRLPKRGFRNLFRKCYQEVTLARLQAAIDGGRVDPGGPIDMAVLRAAGVIRRARGGIRVIGGGELNAKVVIEAAGASKPAAAAISRAGGTLVLPEVKVPAKSGKRQQRKARARAARAASEAKDGTTTPKQA